MGIHNLWATVEKYQHTSTLSQFAQDFFECHNRWPVVAVDIFPFLFEISSGAQTSGQSNFHLQFIRRIRAFLRAGIIPIGVFDGQDKLSKLRHELTRKKSYPQMTKVTLFMKKVLKELGLQICHAPGEGEAQCALIQELGMADYVFSVDSDSLVFGAKRLIYFEKSSEDQKKSLFVRPIRVTELPELTEDGVTQDLNRWRLALRAVLQGNDFSKGVDGIGDLAARACASRDDIVESFLHWYQNPRDDGHTLYDLIYDELTHNRTQIQQKRWKNKQLNRTQLDREVVKAFIAPKTIRPVLAPARAFMRCWREPNYKAILEFWQGESPVKVSAKSPLASDGKAPRKLVQRDTINRILTELWCLYRIMCNNFDPKYAQPLGKLANTTKFETVRLNDHLISKVCTTVEANTEIKLPVHLTRGLDRRVLDGKPQRPKRQSKEERIAECNSKIAFTRAERPAPQIFRAPLLSPQISPQKSPQEFEDPLATFVDLTAPSSSPVENTLVGLIDLTKRPCVPSISKATTPKPKLRTVSVTNYFTKRKAPAVKSNVKRVKR